MPDDRFSINDTLHARCIKAAKMRLDEHDLAIYLRCEERMLRLWQITGEMPPFYFLKLVDLLMEGPPSATPKANLHLAQVAVPEGAAILP